MAVLLVSLLMPIASLSTATSIGFATERGTDHPCHCTCSDLSTSGPYASGALDLST